MSNSLVRAFFLGRAFAEGLGEEIERFLADALGNAGKFDAEQREKWREFAQRVQVRADAAAESRTAASGASESFTADGPVVKADLQASIDNLRAEIAQLRTELQRYRNHSA